MLQFDTEILFYIELTLESDPRAFIHIGPVRGLYTSVNPSYTLTEVNGICTCISVKCKLESALYGPTQYCIISLTVYGFWNVVYH